MAKYRQDRGDVEHVGVSVDELFNTFMIRELVDDYAIDVWLQERGLLQPNEPTMNATDEALLSWLQDTRWAVTGGDNRDGSEFKETRSDITLSGEEWPLAVARIRQLLIERNTRDRVRTEVARKEEAQSPKLSLSDQVLGAAVFVLVVWGLATYAGWSLIRHDAWSYGHNGLPFVVLAAAVLVGVAVVGLGGLKRHGRHRGFLSWLRDVPFLLLFLLPVAFVVAWFFYAVLVDPFVHR